MAGQEHSSHVGAAQEPHDSHTDAAQYEARIKELKDTIDHLKNDKEELYNQIKNKDYQMNSVYHKLNTLEEAEKPRLVDKLKFWEK